MVRYCLCDATSDDDDDDTEGATHSPNKWYSRYTHIQCKENDVVDKSVEKIDHKACDYLWPYDALKEKSHIFVLR